LGGENSFFLGVGVADYYAYRKMIVAKIVFVLDFSERLSINLGEAAPSVAMRLLLAVIAVLYNHWVV